MPFAPPLWALNAWGGFKSILSAIPREVWYALAAAALLWFVYGQGKGAGYDLRDAEYATAARKAAERAREADAVARDTVDAVNGSTEAQNKAARDAAEGSDDPLKSGLDAL